MTEKDLWQLIRKNIPGHLCRIENLGMAGVPDIHACYRGVMVWLELKIASGQTVYFQSSQLAFMQEAKKNRENVKVLIRKNELLYLIRSNILIKEVYNSINSDKIKFNLSEFSRAYVWGKPWRWNEITQKIYEKEE